MLPSCHVPAQVTSPPASWHRFGIPDASAPRLWRRFPKAIVVPDPRIFAQRVGRKMGREVARECVSKAGESTIYRWYSQHFQRSKPPFIVDFALRLITEGVNLSQHILPHDSWPWFSYRLEKPRTRLSWHEKNQPIFAANALAKCCGPKRRDFGQKDKGRIDVKILYWVQLWFLFRVGGFSPSQRISRSVMYR